MRPLTSHAKANITWRARYFAYSLMVLAFACSESTASADSEWRFNVMLDGKSIGSHTFSINGNIAAEHTVTSNARFDVRLLFITAYSYEHTSTEVWNGNCLLRINSQTDDNGEQFALEGDARTDYFDITGAREGRTRLPACIMTFAYWNPAFLRQTKLLNSQTGDYTTVAVEPSGRERIVVRGAEVDTSRYTLTGKNMQIDVWYTQDGRWVALESLADSGRVIRYELE